MAAIFFYSTTGPYGCLSNFSRHAFHAEGRDWPTSEHYFQAMKFAPANPVLMDRVRAAYTPTEAARLGRSRSFPLRADWEQVKEDVMRAALRYKFTQNEDARRVLLGTANRPLVEHTSNDAYWGDGGDGSGRNRLGALLQELRASLRREAA